MPATTMKTMNETTMELQGDREIVITRTFNGPARMVYAAFSKPEYVRRWWAPTSHGVTVASCEADVRAGGAYRYVLGGRKGEELAFSGTYTEVVPNSRLVYTQVFEPMAQMGDSVVTVTFHEHDGKTDLVMHSRYPSKATRDAVIASGMEHGMRETMEQLEDLVASLV
jgi:uncharacterized protein YndB with AHSA1/START domain